MATNKQVRSFLNQLSKKMYGKGYAYLNSKQARAVRIKGAKLVRR